MPTDMQLLIGAFVVGIVVVAAFVLTKPRAASVAGSRRPGRGLIDHFEETGKDAAGLIVERKLGEYKANEIAKMMGAAFGPSTPPSPPSPNP